MKRKAIHLKETQFRELVSRSVKKILKEALSHPIDGSHGTFGGWETGKYGHDSMEIDFDPTDNDKMAQALQDAFEYGEFKGLSPEMFMEGGQYSDIWPVKVRIDYEIIQGAKGDGYLSPDDPDEVEIKNWHADTNGLGEIKPFVDDLIKSYIEDGYFNEEEILENEGSYLHESFDNNGNERRPGGVFSTDSEEAEGYKKHLKDHDYAGKEDNGNTLFWDPREKRLRDAEKPVTGGKWSDTTESLWDSDRKRDKIANDEFRDEKEESDRYDNPFGDLDDEIENQWYDEPGYEDEDEIAGINENRITLNEEDLRKFISYSVTRILKESNLGITTHFDGKSSFKPENPYEDMTWDEYCETKRREHKEDKGKKDERGEHMFDDQYWVDKMEPSKDDLQEMVRKTLEEVITNGQRNIFITKINDAMEAIRVEMADIEESYEEAEEDPTQSDYYVELRDAYAALKGLIAY